MKRALLGLIVLLAAGCAHARVVETRTVVVQPKPPARLLTASVRVICDGAWHGWAVPVKSSRIAVTAYHVIGGCMSLSWERGFKRGRLLPAKQDKAHDWAILLSDEPFDSWLDIEKVEPEAGELLWWTLLLPGDPPRPAPVSGAYVGTDGGDQMEVNGPSWPGSSGSAMVNTAGELVGIVNGYAGAMYGHSIVYGTPIARVFK
jgi:hypothetical protein